MLNWLRLLLNRQATEASRHACAFVEERNECRVGDVSLRADEADRWVFAVFYKGPLLQRPTPYKIVAVDKVSSVVHEIIAPQSDRYRLRGYK